MKFLLTGACVFFVMLTAAQDPHIITGKVTSAATHAAIPNASVFINSTSRGTVTDTAGNFILRDVPAGTYDLVISSVGYNTVVHTFNSTQLPLKLAIQMQLKIAELDAVTVEPYDPDGWKHWGKLFEDNFLGTAPAANECRIRNYKTLRFRFSKKKNTLTVIADEPLIIENKALGYELKYQLEEFSFNRSSGTVVYLGYPFFTDMAQNKKRVKEKWAINRQTSYDGSFTHFIRSLYYNRLQEEGFEVRRRYKGANTEKQRVKIIYAAEQRRNIVSGGKTVMRMGTSAIPPDSMAYYKQVMAQKDQIDITDSLLLTADSVSRWNADSTRLLYFPNYLAVTYTRGGGEYILEAVREMHTAPRLSSSIFLLNENPVLVMKSGSYYPPQNVFLVGHWAWSEKICHMLPIEYKE